MFYRSTRDSSIKLSSKQAIAKGISDEGGLFVPYSFPKYSSATLNEMKSLDYIDRAKIILKDFLTDFSEDELMDCLTKAYANDKFDIDNLAPLVQMRVNKNIYILELWHGPTSAFKDMALQILPHLLKKSFSEVYKNKEAIVLVATSGDTGKAALEGFKNVPRTKICVFYPEEGVSDMQRLQMVTTEGNNTYVAAIKGNFDDAQTAVKQVFTDAECNKKINESGYVFSSANSINFGRLAPQIVYYIYGYVRGVFINENIVDINTVGKGNIVNAFYLTCVFYVCEVNGYLNVTLLYLIYIAALAVKTQGNGLVGLVGNDKLAVGKNILFSEIGYGDTGYGAFDIHVFNVIYVDPKKDGYKAGYGDKEPSARYKFIDCFPCHFSSP